MRTGGVKGGASDCLPGWDSDIYRVWLLFLIWGPGRYHVRLPPGMTVIALLFAVVPSGGEEVKLSVLGSPIYSQATAFVLGCIMPFVWICQPNQSLPIFLY